MGNKTLKDKVKAVDTGFWVSDGWIWGPINSGKYGLTKDRKIICDSDGEYTVTKDGKILDPLGKETGYFFNRHLEVMGPEYGTLPWMKEKAKRPEIRTDTSEDYGMEIF